MFEHYAPFLARGECHNSCYYISRYVRKSQHFGQSRLVDVSSQFSSRKVVSVTIMENQGNDANPQGGAQVPTTVIARSSHKHLRPERFDCDPSTPTAMKKYKHWIKTFNNYIRSINDTGLDQLDCLHNFVSPDIFDLISDCTTFEAATAALETIFVKPVNEIYNRHVLATKHQSEGESLDQFF